MFFTIPITYFVKNLSSPEETIPTADIHYIMHSYTRLREVIPTAENYASHSYPYLREPLTQLILYNTRSYPIQREAIHPGDFLQHTFVISLPEKPFLQIILYSTHSYPYVREAIPTADALQHTFVSSQLRSHSYR